MIRNETGLDCIVVNAETPVLKDQTWLVGAETVPIGIEVERGDKVVQDEINGFGWEEEKLQNILETMRFDGLGLPDI